MSDASSCRVTRDLGIFDFFRSRSLSLGRRESHRPTPSAPASEPKPTRHSITASSSMPPRARRAAAASEPLNVVAPVSAASCSAFVPPLSEIVNSSATLSASMESLSTNDHLSDDDSDSESDSGTASTGDDNSESGSSSCSVGSAIVKYEVVQELGRGATAVVQLARQRDGEHLVALKVFKTSLLKKMRDVKRVGRRMVVSTALDKVQMEIAIMKKLHHPNLLNLLEVFDDDSETLVLMLEYAPSGQVMTWFPEEMVYKKSGSKRGAAACFSEEELRVCVRQLLLGLQYLHDNNICHRDLKPENILVGQDGTYKISDFGVAHFFEEEDKEAKLKSSGGEASLAAAKPHRKGYVSTTAGTYAFMGPETLKGGEYSAYAADIWALGVTIHALALGAIPFYDPDVVTLFEMIENGPVEIEKKVKDSSGLSKGLTELLYGLLEKNPEKRWSLQKCKEHSWVLQGLSKQEQQEYVQTSYDAVTIGPEELARAVTRVVSLNVILRVKLGANKWKRRAMQTLKERRQLLQNDGESTNSDTSRSVRSLVNPSLNLIQSDAPQQSTSTATALTSAQLAI
uniref:Protein kinase domain-containing protein n=1 Tax=Hyaloperonospora arabidopsidis (strain Emoy2) TaxID=559515 RepID=M4BRM3_HYAAE